MPLLLNNNSAVFYAKLEHRYQIVRHELCGNGPAMKRWIALFAKEHVLLCLNDGMVVLAALGLHRNNKLASGLIDPNVNFVDLDLTASRNGRSKVAL